QPVGAGQDADRAAAQPGDVIDGGLEGLVGVADQVGLLRADGDGQPLLPVGLDGVAGRGPRPGDRGPLVRPGQSQPGPGPDQARGGPEEVSAVTAHGESSDFLSGSGPGPVRNPPNGPSAAPRALRASSW